MKKLLTDSSVVVSAADVNLSIFKPPWLTKSGFLRQDELEGQIVISPVVVQIPTKGFQLTVLPNRIQMNFRGPAPGSNPEVERVMGGIVRILPHTPYSGCGLNFNYLVTVAANNYRSWDERLCASEAARKAGALDLDDARFGTYFSFNALGARLKLDAKPTYTIASVCKIDEDWQEGSEVIRLNFNYHFAVADGETSEKPVLSALDKWEEAATHSRSIVARLAD